jgi:Bacterial capsule synthesis protein PGA_cap
MRATWPLAPAITSVLLASACAGVSGAVETSRPAPPAASSPGSSAGASPSKSVPAPATPEAAPVPVSDARVLTMAFGGDVHFEEYLRPVARSPQGLAELRSTLGAADLSMVNLETAITERGREIGKEFHFRAPASALDTLAKAGVDAVTMANNHGADFGAVGLRDTLAAKKASPIPIVGIGSDEDDAFAPATLEAKGVRVAVFGASQVYEMTLLNWSADADSPGIASSAPVTRLRSAVAKAAKSHDVVVVYMHWGLDYQKCPDGQSASTAAALEEAGADIIVGGHSHRVNGAGWLDRAYVGYGLGNFVWWRSREPDSRTGVLTLDIDVAAATAPKQPKSSVVRAENWTPMLIGADGIPRVPSGPDAKRLHALWEQSRSCTGLASSP